MIWWPTEVPTLQYGLITLRKPEERDIIPLYEGVQDPIIPKFTRIPANYQMANAEHYVRERSPNGFTMRTELQLALEYDGKFAGALSFHTLDLDDAKAEIGYWITADVRGKGVATAFGAIAPIGPIKTIFFIIWAKLGLHDTRPQHLGDACKICL